MDLAHRTAVRGGRDRSRPRWAALALAVVLTGGCASVPPQVAQTHQKELEILTSLQQSHLAMVDAYVDQKITVFESFFFREYGPAYLRHWRTQFKAMHGRDYDEARDFQTLYNDLVAEYQTEVAPLETIRRDLREAIAREYRNALGAHEAVGSWLKSLERLNAAHRESLDRLLAGVKPGLSLDSVTTAVNTAIANVRDKAAKLAR
jgi:hypothetical protein